MKKRVLIILVIFFLVAAVIYFITSPKVEIWTYKNLPNQYAIKKTSSTEVVLGKYSGNIFETKKDSKVIGVEDYIAEFSYGKNYISLKCLESKKNQIEIKFYIVDTKNEEVYGPYKNEETYNEVKKEIIDEDIGEWIKTITTPKGAIYE